MIYARDYEMVALKYASCTIWIHRATLLAGEIIKQKIEKVEIAPAESKRHWLI